MIAFFTFCYPRKKNKKKIKIYEEHLNYETEPLLNIEYEKIKEDRIGKFIILILRRLIMLRNQSKS